MVEPQVPICDICKKPIKNEQELVIDQSDISFICYHKRCHEKALGGGLTGFFGKFTVRTLDSSLNLGPFQVSNILNNGKLQSFKEYYRRKNPKS